MKKLHIILLFLAVLLNVSALAAAFTKEKKINDRFTTDGYSKLRITNQYGKVHINTWSKNEVTINIVVTAKAETEERAKSLLTEVDITQQKADNRFIYYTAIKRKKFSLKDNADELSVDYTINMPHNMFIELKNRFGDVFIDDFSGQMHLSVEYGAVKVQKLTGNVINMEVDFGSLSIASADNAYIISRYSKVNVDRASKLTVTSRFGKSNISNVKRLTLSQDYGDVALNNIEVLKGDISYSGFTIDKLGTEAVLNMQYCTKCNLGTISGKTERLSVHAKFSKLTCIVENNADMSVAITTKFGSVNGLSLQKTEVDEDRYNSSYRGKLGAGAGKMSMSLEYTDVNFK